ncbi:MAG TPA: HD domain-containing protein [Planctomycetota bacterium]|nr:HD domain-containing protein [Planctomycetota bacterium]
MTTFDLRLVPKDVFTLIGQLAAAGRRAWIVGGCVRDSLLGKPATDWDLATDARPDELMRIFPRAIPTGLQHGTVTLVMGGRHYEVTTLRGEASYSDGRRPDAVRFVGDIEADLARRDFTINAIAVDPASGALIDPHGGRRDLDAKVIRAVGVARERFAEDGLRVLRAARFAATLEFDLATETFAAIGPTLDTFRKVSAERVRDEWIKTMRARRPSRAFEVMRESGMLAVTCPELLEGVDMEQNKWHSFDVWRHGMACMDACVGDPVLRIAALLHDVGKPRTRAFSDKTKDYTFYEHDRVGAEIAEPICERLRFSNDERLRITALVRHHLFHYDQWTDAAVRRWIRRVGKDRLEDLYALSEADTRAKAEVIEPELLLPIQALRSHVERVLAKGAALSTRDLAIDGDDLMREFGRPPGRWIGEVLDALLEDVTAEPAGNERTALLHKARSIVEGRSGA